MTAPGGSPLEVLLRMTERMEQAGEPEQRLQAALGCALEALEGCLGALVLEEPGGPLLRATRGELRTRCAPELYLCTWMAARAMESGHPLELEEARPHLPGALRSTGLGALLAIPFHVAPGSPRGVLCLGTRHPRRFRPEEVMLLRLMAERLGLALEQERLQAGQRYLRAIFDQVPDALLIADDEARYLEANPAACDMLGMPLPQLLGRTIFDLAGVPPEHTGELWHQFLEQGAQKGEFELRDQAGRRLFVEYAARAHVVPGRHLALLREVTRRKRSELLLELLTEASEVLVGSLSQTQVLEAVPPVAVKQLGSLCLLRLLEEGSPWHMALSPQAQELEALPPELRHYQPPASWWAPALRALHSGQVLEGQTTPLQAAARMEDARVARWLLGLEPYAYLVVPLMARQRLSGVLVLVSTRPGFRYEEEERVAALELARLTALALESARLHEQARDALRLRQEMMAMVTHDLRNPLNALLLRSISMERKATKAGDTTTQADAKALQHMARHMEHLLMDMVDMVVIETGKLSLELRPQSVGELLNEAMELAEPLGRQREVEVELRPLEGSPQVKCDRQRILQVLSNLLCNALKFTPAGGRVVLSAFPRDGQFVFSVSDTGPGLKPEQLPHVFDRYWRAAEARGTTGLGLGLAIVKGIIQGHGGRVWVESQPGHGSTFLFALPLPP